MCFLKTLKPLDDMSLVNEEVLTEVPSQDDVKESRKTTSYLNSLLQTKTPLLMNKQDQLLFNLISSITSNSTQLQYLDQKLTQNEQHLSCFLQDFNSIIDEAHSDKKTRDFEDLSSGETINEYQAPATEPLIVKMFGKKNYKYRLQVLGDVPTLIYKERNINIPVQLVTLQNEKILNSNIVHLNMGVCDANGEWINENKGGENFMKGKTEVEMYHGQGSFLKVYPREVSRGYADGRINFVIYAKQSVLKFMNNNSSLQKEVDSNLIEPLLLKDICIRAKKKE